MGLDRKKRTPCGFCFIEYYDREAAEDAINILNYTRLDDRLLKIDWDYGYTEKRRFGRGKSGGQVRDEYKEDFDPGRALISLPVTDASAPSAPMTAAAAATTTTTTAPTTTSTTTDQTAITRLEEIATQSRGIKRRTRDEETTAVLDTQLEHFQKRQKQ
eukprot:CAMPEP_0201549534 /NCGR_PEP_ID=MMETSP0173_2-20130828/5999_1 /ASSEMBLY_ACC=CAM_ASM_000268 /TAXON_ID=218659 /ORGANISM="Vexillifera sp., Strain DIVA3 564/2" /LENGTH=158 /DNA_ID=CAMNT_0047959229 /DNA_START=329 /DNA_END=805 /DNA_ORIENTATION=-